MSKAATVFTSAILAVSSRSGLYYVSKGIWARSSNLLVMVADPWVISRVVS
jgi:hypothetical protein